jgi:hypothetical protein
MFCYIATHKNRRRAKRGPHRRLLEGRGHRGRREKLSSDHLAYPQGAANSRQPLKQNFIIFRDGAYQLNPEFSYRIDAEEFGERIADAQAAKREGDDARLRVDLESAYALYRGEYMEGLYEDWAEEQRPAYGEQFLRVLNALAKLSVAEKSAGTRR